MADIAEERAFGKLCGFCIDRMLQSGKTAEEAETMAIISEDETGVEDSESPTGFRHVDCFR